jgi:hypothetical protein
VSLDSQDRELTIAMREVLAFAKKRMPESILVIFSFTHAEDDSAINMNKIATNGRDRAELQDQVFTVMTSFVAAQVVDLTDTKGGMQ